MTCEEIYAAKPGPELDALVHLYYGGGSSAVPPYSTNWPIISRLAFDHNLGLDGCSIGGHIIMSLVRDGQDLKVGDSVDLEGACGVEVPPEVLAELAARSLLKFVLYHPELQGAAIS